MYAPGPSEAELAAIGITREDIADNSITDIWPENNTAFRIFYDLPTQWICGPGGPVGLNYPSVIEISKLYGVKRKHQLEVLKAIQIMEGEALRQMREANK